MADTFRLKAALANRRAAEYGGRVRTNADDVRDALRSPKRVTLPDSHTSHVAAWPGAEIAAVAGSAAA